MLEGENIICVSWLEWDSVPLVMHHMMQRLAKKNRVLFVDVCTPITRFLVDFSNRAKHTERWRRWRQGAVQIENQLWVLYPPPIPVFFGRGAITDWINQKILLAAVRNEAARLNFKTPLLWLYHPYAILPNKELSEKLVIYDCNDDVGFFFHRIPYQRRRLDKLERRLIERADVVFVTSPNLFHAKKQINPNTHFFPSGADISVFGKALSPQTVVAPEMSRIKPPIVGFFGGMDNKKMAWRWVETAAAQHPEWSFVFIGPVFGSPPEWLTSRPNVHFIGAKPMESLPGFLKVFAVGIIPYSEGPFLDSCFPTKVFEYLAGGIPVVSSDIPALREYQPVIKLARDSTQFTRHLEEIIAQPRTKAMIDKYLETARSHTWEARLEGTSQVVAELLNQRDMLPGRSNAP